jgi:hypothetical protein
MLMLDNREKKKWALHEDDSLYRKLERFRSLLTAALGFSRARISKDI